MLHSCVSAALVDSDGGGSCATFADEQDHAAQGGDRVTPPPAERGIEGESGEHDRGQPGARPRLVAVGDGGAAGERVGDTPLADGQPRHDSQRHEREDDPYQRCRGLVVTRARMASAPTDAASSRKLTPMPSRAVASTCSTRCGSRRSAVVRHVSTAAETDSVALSTPNPNSA